jgi:hypothetical protein
MTSPDQVEAAALGTVLGELVDLTGEATRPCGASSTQCRQVSTPSRNDPLQLARDAPSRNVLPSTLSFPAPSVVLEPVHR